MVSFSPRQLWAALPEAIAQRLPRFLWQEPAAWMFNRVFAREIAEGSVDFLRGRIVEIRVRELPVSLALGFDGRHFLGSVEPGRADLRITGRLDDYGALIAGQADPDTLFFQRRLQVEGSAELGVHLKHFLAGVDPETLPFIGLARIAWNQWGAVRTLGRGVAVRR